MTVLPLSALLTTQEAADLLGVSRPALLRLLPEGQMACEHRGCRRRVLLAGVLAYQQRMRRERRESPDRMAASGQPAGLDEATSGPVPRTR